MTANIKLKESYEVEAKYGSFFTGGNVEWLSEKILLCQKESSLQFLDLESGSVTHSIGEGDESVEDTDTIHTFTSNAVGIVSAHKSGLLKLWRHDGALEKMWKSIHKGPVSRLCLDTDNKLASGGSDGIVRIWDIKFQTCTHSLKGCQGVISVVAFHPKEEIVFAAGDDTKIRSWNLTNANQIHEYAGHFSKITSLTFTNDSKQMISSSRDKVLILWNISQGQAVRTIPVFESIETVLVLSDKFKVAGQKYNEGLFVATAGEKGIIRLWNLNTNKEIFVQENSLITPAKEDGGLAITKLLFQADVKQFAVVSVDHNIILHNLKTFECVKQFVGFSDEILDACFLGKTDEYLAVASNSADIKLYAVSNMNCKLLQGHTDIVLALCKAATEPLLLLSSSKDNTIRLWRISDASDVFCVGVGARHTGSVGSVAFSKSSATYAVSVSQDTCLKVWEIPQNCVKMSEKSTEIQSLECLRTEIAHQKDINCVTISPNDKIIATGSQDKLCKLWDQNLQLLGVLRGHKRGIWCAKFSPVDQVLITSSADCTVKLWSIQDLNCLKTLEGHESSVLKLEFLSNGMQIMSAGADGLLKVFSVKSSECSMTLDQHEGRVWALALNSDENTIFSGGSDSMLVKWKDVTLEKKLEKAKQDEELIVQVQQLANLVQNNELLKALKLSLRLDRPFQTLKIVQGIIKQGDSGLTDTVKELSNDQKESLLKCASSWNTNSKHCQPAQLVINILINEVQSGDFKIQGLRTMIEGNLGYTDRHFKRLTQLMQDLYLINYTVNCMQPHAKKDV